MHTDTITPAVPDVRNPMMRPPISAVAERMVRM